MEQEALRTAIAGIPAGHLRLRVAIDLSDLLQQDVADRVGISPAAMSKVVNGLRPIGDGERGEFAKALGLTVADLFGQEVTA